MSIKNIVFAAVEMDIVKHHAENSLGRNVSTMTILGY
jgi:hypothetical protein